MTSSFVVIFTAYGLLTCVSAQSYGGCSYSRMNQCKDAILNSIRKRINDMTRQDQIQHCGIIRDDFNCLLRETRCLTTESERQRNDDVIRKGLVYLRDACDSSGGGWRENSCFIGEGIKSCENTYPINSGQYSSQNTESCRKYNLFYECVMHTMKNRCRPDEDRLLGQYLVDKAQDLAWNCAETDQNRDWDRERDSGRYGGGGYDRYSSDYDRYRGTSRDRGDQWRSDATYDRDRYGSDRYDRHGGTSGRTYDRDYGGARDITCCRNERCDTPRMQQCKDSLTRTIDDRAGGYQDIQKCRKTRDDFNCLLWQTTCLPREERDRMNDVFRRARDYISRYCDTYGRWSENSCYKSTAMQRCESYLSNTRGGAAYESCRAYNSFRDCMTEELRRSCTREDELFQGSFLVEKAQELSWQCQNSDSTTMNNRYQLYPSTDRRSPYGDTYGGGAQYGAYEDPLHLDDDDAMCRSRMQGLADTCKRELDDKRRRRLIEDDYDARQRLTCCSARQYQSCLTDATRRVCHRERSRVVDSFMGRERYELQKDECRRLYDSDCDGAVNLKVSTSLILVAVIMFLRSFM